MKAFLNYEYMITPGVLKILSYIGMVLAVIAGLFTAFTADLWTGLLIKPIKATVNMIFFILIIFIIIYLISYSFLFIDPNGPNAIKMHLT